MATKPPLPDPDWALTPVDPNQVVEPPIGLRNEGFAPNDPLPHGFFNWLDQQTSRWIRWWRDGKHKGLQLSTAYNVPGSAAVFDANLDLWTLASGDGIQAHIPLGEGERTALLRVRYITTGAPQATLRIQWATQTDGVVGAGGAPVDQQSNVYGWFDFDYNGTPYTKGAEETKLVVLMQNIGPVGSTVTISHASPHRDLLF